MSTNATVAPTLASTVSKLLADNATVASSLGSTASTLRVDNTTVNATTPSIHNSTFNWGYNNVNNYTINWNISYITTPLPDYDYDNDYYFVSAYAYYVIIVCLLVVFIPMAVVLSVVRRRQMVARALVLQNQQVLRRQMPIDNINNNGNGGGGTTMIELPNFTTLAKTIEVPPPTYEDATLGLGDKLNTLPPSVSHAPSTLTIATACACGNRTVSTNAQEEPPAYDPPGMNDNTEETTTPTVMRTDNLPPV